MNQPDFRPGCLLPARELVSPSPFLVAQESARVYSLTLASSPGHSHVFNVARRKRGSGLGMRMKLTSPTLYAYYSCQVRGCG